MAFLESSTVEVLSICRNSLVPVECSEKQVLVSNVSGCCPG
jgi:hypothetical protein